MKSSVILVGVNEYVCVSMSGSGLVPMLGGVSVSMCMCVGFVCVSVYGG